MTVGEMLDRMSSLELSEWKEHWVLDAQEAEMQRLKQSMHGGSMEGNSNSGGAQVYQFRDPRDITVDD